MVLPAKTWQALVTHSADYCDKSVPAYDDSIHAMQNAIGLEQRRVMEPGWLTSAYPRCVHVGRCGGMSFRLEDAVGDGEDSASSACDVAADLEAFVRTWLVPMLPGGPLAGAIASSGARTMPKHPRKAWRVPEGVHLCRERYVPDGTSGRKAGVATLNHTMPQRFSEMCETVLKGI